VAGTGFAPSEAVDIYFDNTDMLLVVTNSAGALPARQLNVPASALAGEHWVTAIGRKSGDAAQVAFTVSTDWKELGFSSHGKRVNPYENVLSADNVPGLDVAWSAAIGG